MAMAELEQWYSNKELFEMVQSLKIDLKETNSLIKEYNGLRKRLDQCELTLVDLCSQSKGRSAVAKGIREWGGWIIAICTVLITIYKSF